MPSLRPLLEKSKPSPHYLATLGMWGAPRNGPQNIDACGAAGKSAVSRVDKGYFCHKTSTGSGM